MKNIKKIFCLLLVATMLLSVVGCSNSSANKDVSDDTITITDHNGDTVTLPKEIERIVVCDILPLPSVLAVFFDSAEKIVGMSDTSMSAAKNSLLSELYPEILNAETGFINGSQVNVEEVMALKPDVVFYNASSKQLGDQLKMQDLTLLLFLLINGNTILSKLLITGFLYLVKCSQIITKPKLLKAIAIKFTI